MAEEGFSSPTNIAWQGHTGVVEYGGGDKGQVCMFYNKSVPNPAKSVAAGRPINEDVVFVRIHPPGERLNIVERPAIESDSRRWPQQWAQFRQNQQQTPEGTPIDLLYPEHPSIAATLRAFGVHTIEQCAELSGPAIDNIGMGAQRYVNEAQKYLSAANKGVKAAQYRVEMEQKDREIKVLTRQVEDLSAQVRQLLENGANNNALGQVQQLLAGLQGRPTYPAPMPGQSVLGIDPQTAMINSTHATAQVAQRQKVSLKSKRRARPSL